MAQVEKRTGAPLPLAGLLDAPTVEQLAGAIRNHRRRASRPPEEGDELEAIVVIAALDVLRAVLDGLVQPRPLLGVELVVLDERELDLGPFGEIDRFVQNWPPTLDLCLERDPLSSERGLAAEGIRASQEGHDFDNLLRVNHQIVGDEHDPSAPVVMLLHGFSGSADELLSFARSLSAPARFVFPDSPLDLSSMGLPGRAWWPINAAARDEPCDALASLQAEAIQRALPLGVPPEEDTRKLAAFLECFAPFGAVPEGGRFAALPTSGSRRRRAARPRARGAGAPSAVRAASTSLAGAPER
jgi:hypothetical protein